MAGDRARPLGTSSRSHLGARALGWLVPALLACEPAPAPKLATGPSPRLARYEVEVDDGGSTLLVHMRLAPGAPTRFELEDGAARFAKHLRVETTLGSRERPSWSGATLVAPACKLGCAITYEFDLRAAARAFDDPATAAERSGAFLSPPSTWLLHPEDPPTDTRFEIAVRSRDGAGFASGSRSEDGRYAGTWEDLAEPPYAAVGPMRHLDVPAGDRQVHVAIVGPHPDVGDEGIARWVSAAASNVRVLDPDYPRLEPMIIVVVEPGVGIEHGSAMGNGGASILVEVGQATPEDAYRDDWILTHEMIHLTLPGLARAHHWAEEGMATYLEPILRARRGLVPVDQVWREWLLSMHQGQPFPDDRGLDETPTWGRTYWGGALFWLSCDVEIRRRTRGRHELADAFRAIYREGDISVRWPMSRVVSAADRATETTVVSELYRRHAHAAVKVDLDGLFAELGASIDGGHVRLDDGAPLAAIRRSIVRGP